LTLLLVLLLLYSSLISLELKLHLLDLRAMNNEAVFAKHTGMVILGGGLIKHHICNANLMVCAVNFFVIFERNLLFL
jgi:deoxyhypusine synthase